MTITSCPIKALAEGELLMQTTSSTRPYLNSYNESNGTDLVCRSSHPL